MKTEFRNIRLLIFDLDGTLYEDTDHFDYYATLLKQQLPPEQQSDFAHEYRQALSGEHAVAIGKAYDVNRDTILTLNPATLLTESVQEWDGSHWSPERVRQTYPDPVTLDFEQIVAIGDGWWIPFALAKHFGVEEIYPSYVKTKDYLAANQHLLTRTPGLREWILDQRKSKRLVLVTNSEEEDVRRLLRQLNLDGLFHQVVSSAHKPTRTTAIFRELLAESGVKPIEAVSIGDNFLNEVAPALNLGMNAVFLQQTPFNFEHEHLLTVKSMRDLF